ncbi:MAG: DNA pilot protein [Microvirus sp.]|nr:MAG: DNA pilot protein [Microvirus sp.]
MSFWKKIKKSLKKIGPAVAAAGATYLTANPAIGASVYSGLSALGSAGASPSVNSGGSAAAFGPEAGFSPPGDFVPTQRVENSAPRLPPEAPGFNLDKYLPLVGGGLQYIGQRQTNASNAQQAQQQMEFQNAQTSTSYQRGVKDMQAAGLNPMLAYSQGGAQSGTGAMAQMGNELGSGVSGTIATAQAQAQLENMGANTALQHAQARETESRIPVNQQTVNSGQASETLSREQVANTAQQTKNLLQEFQYKELTNPDQALIVGFKRLEANWVQLRAKNLIPESDAQAEFWKFITHIAKLISPAAIKVVNQVAGELEQFKTAPSRPSKPAPSWLDLNAFPSIR